MSKSEEIMALLEALKNRDGRVLACMVAKRGLDGLIMFPPTFMNDVADVWEPLSKSVDDLLLLVGKYSHFGVARLYLELLGFGVFFLPLPMSDTALVVFAKGGSPIEESGGIMAEMESTRESIITAL